MTMLKKNKLGIIVTGAALMVAFLFSNNALAGGSYYDRTLSQIKAESPRVINFESTGVSTDSGYWSNYGVKFSSNNGKAIYINDYNRGGDTSSGEYSISNNATFPKTSNNDPLIITFKNPVNKIGFYLGNGAAYGQQVTAVISFYDANGNKFGDFTVNGIEDEVTKFVGFETINPFYKITIDYGDTSLSEEIDDLMFVNADTNVVSNVCQETDNGLDYNKKGSTTGKNEGTNVQGEYQDSCGAYVGDQGADAGAYIVEKHCSGPTDSPYVHTQWYKCPYGCGQGQCLLSPAVTIPQVVGFLAYDQKAGKSLIENKDSYQKNKQYFTPSVYFVPTSLESFTYSLKTLNTNGNSSYGFVWANKGEDEVVNYSESEVKSLLKTVNFSSNSSGIFNITDYYRGKYVMLYAFTRNNDGISAVPNMPVEVDDVTVVYLKFNKDQIDENVSGCYYLDNGGKRIKSSGDSNVWYVYNNQKHLFPNGKIYNTWYSDFSGIQVITSNALDGYVRGSNVCSNPNYIPSNICTDSDNGIDYYTKGKATLYSETVNSSADFCDGNKTLREYFCTTGNAILGTGAGYDSKLYECPYGCSEGACKNAPEENVSCYNVTGNGYLAKAWDDNKVWYVDNTSKHWLPSEKVFFSWFNSFANIQIITKEKLNQLSLGKDTCFKNGSNIIEEVPNDSCSDINGGDGAYSLCVGNKLTHNSGIVMKNQRNNNNYVWLMVENSEKKSIVINLNSSREIYTSNLANRIRISYSQNSGDSGASLSIQTIK